MEFDLKHAIDESFGGGPATARWRTGCAPAVAPYADGEPSCPASSPRRWPASSVPPPRSPEPVRRSASCTRRATTPTRSPPAPTPPRARTPRSCSSPRARPPCWSGPRSTSGSPRCCSPPTGGSGATAGSTTRAAARAAPASPSTRWTRRRTRTGDDGADSATRAGWGCPTDNELVPADCDTISFSMMERRSEEVARVDAELINGAKLSTEAERGFYAFEYRRRHGPAAGQQARRHHADGGPGAAAPVLRRRRHPDRRGDRRRRDPDPRRAPDLRAPELTGTPYGFEEPPEEPATDGPVDDGPDRRPEPGLTGEGQAPGRLHPAGRPGRRPELVDPRVVSWHETAHTAVAVLLGADGKSWASCVLPDRRRALRPPGRSAPSR